jgi:aldose 1-epimerase
MSSSQSRDATSAFNFLTRGALIQKFEVAGHNIVLNFPEAELYASVAHPHFGETIGRTTNRIKDAVLHNLNGRNYKLFANDGQNNLHGGKEGWGTRTWAGPDQVVREGKEAVLFLYVSPDGEEGFPGTVEARVWYMESIEKGKKVLDVEYEIRLIGEECQETVVGITNHRYFSNHSICHGWFLRIRYLRCKSFLT